MRFSLATAALATMAVGVVAAEEPVQTVVVTETATFCPKVSTLPVSEQTTVTQPAPVSATNVRYSTTRPLITSTVTRCSKCATKTPVLSIPSSVNPVPGVPSNGPSGGSVVIPSSSATPSAPVIPSGPAPSGVSPSGVPSGVAPSGSGTTPAAPIFTGGASRAAAGAGAGLATVFGLVAYLL
ncbi:putative GPI anchored protein [Aspergillus affinis]|uniref:putative GPI anchored protein n=1 Tax=Aspergillus affinis TaxID=1070780 RepID=UPI0022FE4312|nr:uncharacterized protein KD926_001651 [Aspergillus affinis]KAI9036577.1 hypothetical protein KD926_001651 [Aspergillus affinis]